VTEVQQSTPGHVPAVRFGSDPEGSLLAYPTEADFILPDHSLLLFATERGSEPEAFHEWVLQNFAAHEEKVTLEVILMLEAVRHAPDVEVSLLHALEKRLQEAKRAVNAVIGQQDLAIAFVLTVEGQTGLKGAKVKSDIGPYPDLKAVVQKA
jgi:hypothetical protein